uniref:Uncharacterized protein n=1 Tax=Clytia hemisphaerica TaxID=252671 RepID=A0A7M5V8V5_9CNID
MWETVARDDDPFIRCNFIPLDLKELQEKGFLFKTQQDVHDYIKKHIIGKPNEQLVKNVHKEIDFLGVVGPDALINSFTVNCKDQSTGKGQQNIELVNDLQNLVFNELTYNVGEDTKRVKMFLTTSKLEYANYGKSVQQLKERLNLPTENTHDALGS